MPRLVSVQVLLFVLACSSLVASAAGVAHADGMRCGTRLVSGGDTLFEVQERCGAPDATMQHTELRTVRSWISTPCFRENGVVRCGTFVEQTIQVIIDEWSYDFGPTNLVRYLTFEQGHLVYLKTGGYGSKQD